MNFDFLYYRLNLRSIHGFVLAQQVRQLIQLRAGAPIKAELLAESWPEYPSTGA